MNRKDTIIIAVFVNAAILIALVVSAVRSHRSEEKEEAIVSENSAKIVDLPINKGENAQSEIKTPQATLAAKTEIKAAEGDEVDMVLKQFAQNAPALVATSATGEPTKEGAAPGLDFAQDLQTFAPVASVPTVTENSTEVSSSIQVTVKKGDALEKIARAHHTTVKEIMRLNNLKNAQLRIGQVLKVTPGKGKKNSTATIAKVSSEGAKYYTVKNGDNPWTIAVKNHMKVEELLKLNDLDAEKARHLKPGQKLRVN